MPEPERWFQIPRENMVTKNLNRATRMFTYNFCIWSYTKTFLVTDGRNWHLIKTIFGRFPSLQNDPNVVELQRLPTNALLKVHVYCDTKRVKKAICKKPCNLPCKTCDVILVSSGVQFNPIILFAGLVMKCFYAFCDEHFLLNKCCMYKKPDIIH